MRTLRITGHALVVAAACAAWAGGAGTPLVRAAAPPSTPISLRPCDADGNELSGPGYYILQSQRGTSRRQYALVSNRSNRQLQVSIQAVDATSGVYGGVSYNLPETGRRAVGAWIHLSTTTVRLDPGKATVVPFTVQVPKRLTAGDHIGGLTAFVPVKTATRKGKGPSLRVQTRVVTAVEVTVPGPRYGRFTPMGVALQHGPNAWYLLVHIRDSGTMLLQGQGRLLVYRIGTRAPVVSTALTLDTTVPGTTVHYPIRWSQQRPRTGLYTFAVTVKWKGGQATRRGSFRVR